MAAPQDTRFVDPRRSYRFDGPIPRQVLENYLSRAISMEGLLNGRGDLTDNIRMLKSVGAKFIGRSLCLWGGEANLLSNLERARQEIPLVHAADPDMVLQACVFEIVTRQVEQVAVPDWAFAALAMPAEKRNFRYEDMLYPDGRHRNQWGRDASVPDVSRPETKLWFYFLAASYVDLGIEAIHFGQAEIMNGNDPELDHWAAILDFVHGYARKHARRHFVLCDAHVPSAGLLRHGKLLLDFHSFPLRIKEVPEVPQEAILQVGFSDGIYGRSKGGRTPSGWTCDHLPYLVELDNWGASRQPGQAGAGGIWVWGYDEITWFAHQSKDYRKRWLRYAWDWVRQTDPAGHLQMPGSRTMRSPLDGRRWYYANAPGPAVPEGLDDEEAIRMIWSGQSSSTPFEGEPSAWHEGFDRHDFIMDASTMAITPLHRAVGEGFGIGPPQQGTRRCVVICPKQAAPGNPWSWRGCYWDHQPQTEIALLRRGFHIAYISADASLKPDRCWDAWYAFLTEQHGLSRKPVFVGMSRGGEYAFTWATTHPDKVAAIYADNPGGNDEIFRRLPDIARSDVPLLLVCGTIDPILHKFALPIEAIYNQFGGRVSMMLKEGAGHHPHSLRDPTPIVDFLEHSSREIASAPSDFAAGHRVTRYAYYGSESTSAWSPAESCYITRRGPAFSPCYDRYEVSLDFATPVTIIAPQKEAAGRPWVLRAGFPNRDAGVDQGLLARGFHVVVGPVGFNADGPDRAEWDRLYSYLTSHGFSHKPVLEGAGGGAVAVLSWASENADSVACIYTEDPILRTTGSTTIPPEGLVSLARAGVPLLALCGDNDPFLVEQIRELEKRYQGQGGKITTLMWEHGSRHPSARPDPGRIIGFIVGHAT